MPLRRVVPLTVLLCLVIAGSAQADVFTVTTTADSGAGSLRKAIDDANLTAAADTIAFAIPTPGPYKILTSANPLPTITHPVIIDGYSQPGTSANTLSVGSDAVLKIEISGRTGLVLRASNSTIKGLVLNSGDGTGSGGSGGAGAGIDSQGSNNVFEGNFIGTLPDGVTATTEQAYLEGIVLGGIAGDTANRIGGTTPGARNVIAGKMSEGIRLYDNYNQGSTNTTIQGNYIGPTAAGTAAPTGPGMSQGIHVYGGNTGTTIGGSGPGQGNLISGVRTSSDQGTAIQVESGTAGTSQGTIRGNLIGTKPDGTSPLGNGTYAIIISGARGWTVGGANPGEGNVIAFNGYLGVQVKGTNAADGAGDRNRISGNSIHHNGSFGIDLSLTLNQAGVDANDDFPPDGDVGANEGQNYPVIGSGTVSAGSASVAGSLFSNPNKTFRVEFFVSAACGTSGYGEGQTYLGFKDVSTDATGNVSFNSGALPTAAPAGQTVFAATATDADGNTSEFSKCTTAGGVTPPAQCADGIDNDGDGKTDFPADLGCSSTTDTSESPDPTPPAGGGGTLPPSGGQTTPPPPSSAPTVVTPSTFNALGSTSCSRRAISLIRADVRGKTVVLSGLVGAGLAKAKVTVKANYRSKGKPAMATATADAKGQFSVKLTGPSAKGFVAARYTAVAGSAKSIQLRLTQSLATSSIRQSSGKITLKGKVKKSLLGRRNPVVIKRLVCGSYRKVTSVKPGKDGSYSATFAGPGAGSAALYRAESVVLVRPGAKKYAIQYARAVSITVTGQTG